MDEELVKQVNEMVDKMEAGKITKREFFRYLAGLGLLFTGVEPFVRAAENLPNFQTSADLVRTGVKLRVREQEGASSGVLEGLISPGAYEYAQVDAQGQWNYTITQGQAVMKIGDQTVILNPGDQVGVAPNEKVSFLNPGTAPWSFQANFSPNWHPDAVSYQYAGQSVAGKEAWFEIKTSLNDTVKRPLYHVYGWASSPLNSAYVEQNTLLKSQGIGLNPAPVSGTTIDGDFSGVF